MCCLFSLLCQHHQRRKFAYRNRRSAVAKLCLFFVFGASLLNISLAALDETEIVNDLTELRVQELHNLAIRLEHSIDGDKNPCDSYFDYVCGRNRPLFSVMGHLPDNNELVQLFAELQEDPEQFEAKQKLMDFFISCNSHKSLEDCYRETFEYFKPLFGYLISKNYLNSPELQTFVDILDKFVEVAQHTRQFGQESILPKLITLKNDYKTTLQYFKEIKQYTLNETLNDNNSQIYYRAAQHISIANDTLNDNSSQIYFRAAKLNREYESLKIYRGSYLHNIKNLDIFSKRNSAYEMGFYKTVLDWNLYIYQSRNKPISYYYPTLSVHLWMSLYNSSEVRNYEPKKFADMGECLKLPQFANALQEARILAIVYVKSFNSAWNNYKDWILPADKQRIYDFENKILGQYHLSNDKLFFALYGQNFCEFGRELADNVFFVGLKHSANFAKTYACPFEEKNC